ncbi:MAG: hypothetical protein JNL70_06280 [Saprospiraceae bacterium]|nr:hypothetical protein [Saprospiraceae bacterium]
MDKILDRIQKQWRKDGSIAQIAEELSGADFNSLLLALFKQRATKVTPAQLIADFVENRFVKPSDIDPIKSRELELAWLKQAQSQGFRVITLSPVSPLGTCSAMGAVSQHKVISSTRRTEVVADATNVLALHIAHEFKTIADKSAVLRYATVHRHLRAQPFDNPKFTAHFGIFCLVSGGFDRGNKAFEWCELNQHIALILDLLRGCFAVSDMYIKFFLKEDNLQWRDELAQPHHVWHNLPQVIVADTDNTYYQMLQFKIYLRLPNMDIDIADGGFVDWTQQLLGNKKHRTFISGVGIELVQRLLLPQ